MGRSLGSGAPSQATPPLLWPVTRVRTNTLSPSPMMSRICILRSGKACITIWWAILAEERPGGIPGTPECCAKSGEKYRSSSSSLLLSQASSMLRTTCLFASDTASLLPRRSSAPPLQWCLAACQSFEPIPGCADALNSPETGCSGLLSYIRQLRDFPGLSHGPHNSATPGEGASRDPPRRSPGKGGRKGLQQLPGCRAGREGADVVRALAEG